MKLRTQAPWFVPRTCRDKPPEEPLIKPQHRPHCNDCPSRNGRFCGHHRIPQEDALLRKASHHSYIQPTTCPLYNVEPSK